MVLMMLRDSCTRKTKKMVDGVVMLDLGSGGKVAAV
jgi:hypothetical protein